MHRDLIIVGGGPVGLTLALALAGSGITVAVLEARASEDTPRPERTLALSHGSRLLLERIGVWSRLEATGTVTRITTIDISQRGAFGTTRLEAAESGLPALGYVTSYRTLHGALEEAAREAPVDIGYDARASAFSATPSYAHLIYRQANVDQEASARLVAIADGGGDSWLGGVRRRHDYQQRAVVAEVVAESPLPGVAFERFTADGPVALLPYGAGYTLVWTATPARAAAIAALDDAAFRAALHAHFGDRLGAFKAVAARRSFPLALEVAWPRAAARIVALGNAAQALHPVAGQGFNLGLRDAYQLALLLRERDSTGQDPRDVLGSAAQLAAFARARRADRWGGIAFTHGLLAAFSSEHPLLALPRGLALTALDTLPPLKRLFTSSMLHGLR
jgi:2-octaprenyl-6-methoxyphenol hydroxylase